MKKMTKITQTAATYNPNGIHISNKRFDQRTKSKCCEQLKEIKTLKVNLSTTTT